MYRVNKEILIVAMLALSSCGDINDPLADTPEDNIPVAAMICAGVDGGNIMSRASNVTWDTGDEIGVHAASSGRTNYTNEPYKLSSMSWDNTSAVFAPKGGEGTGIFFQDSESVTFSAYYPYTSSGFDNTNKNSIVVSTSNQSDTKKLDYMFTDTKPTQTKNGQRVSFNFKHKMSSVILRFFCSDGFHTDDIFKDTNKFYFNNIAHSGLFDTTTGSANVTSGINPSWDITSYGKYTDSGDGMMFELILFPQEAARVNGATKNNPKIEIAIDGKTYTSELNDNYLTGRKYIYDVLVKKSGLEIEYSGIEEWTPGDSSDIQAIVGE